MLPDIWRPLQAANQAKRCSHKLGWKEPATVGLVYIGLVVVSRTLLTSVVELRQTHIALAESSVSLATLSVRDLANMFLTSKF
jgi:hypothetical protein